MTDIFPERAPVGQNIEGESADRLPVKWSFLIGHHAYHAAQAVLAVRDHGAAGKERHDHVTMAEERLFLVPWAWSGNRAVLCPCGRAVIRSRTSPLRFGACARLGTVWSFAAVNIAVPARRSLLNVNS